MSEVAIYEAYYIAKYKPRCNSDMVFEDEVTFELPELEVCYIIERNEDDFIETAQKYYISKIMEVEKFFQMDNVLLYNEKNVKMLESQGYYDRWKAKQMALEICFQRAKEKEREIVEKIFI